MAGSSAAPFFVTPATLAATPSAAKKAAEKRKAGAIVNAELLRASLESLWIVKRDQSVPLAEIRDVLMDHVLETLETDLKYTVFLVCEDVVDLRPDAKKEDVSEPLEAGTPELSEPLNKDNDASARRSEQSATAAPLPTDPIAFLDGTEDWYRFRSQLSDGDSIPRCDATLLRMPVSKRDMEKEKKAAKKALKMKIKKHKKLTGADGKPGADFYVLSEHELKVHASSLPFDDNERAAAFLATLPLVAGETRAPEQLLLALDCEMCKTTKGVELARLTLVDSNEKVLIDEFVRPTNPIVDYCTPYSGITAEIMDGTSTTLADAQQLFLQHVPASAILVGHSLENDLLALRILHRRIIDTTALYPHPKGMPFRSALRFLASTYLNRAIQTRSDGHCSVEDAVAALHLAQLKIKHGPTFPSIEPDYKQKKVVNELCHLKKSVLLVDSQRACRALSGGAAGIIPCDANDQVARTVVHQLTTGFPPSFTWARLRGARRAEIAAHVRAIRASLPAKTCFLVVLGGDASALRELHKLRTTRSDPRASLRWDKPLQERLDRVAAHTQQGVVHLFLT
ncbi:hypothetical protein PybrP1_006662 [[Pythium] brassicae (nom. inval.)]|nr:hypothetical protein PybrP1_006662 [[Pythium] brassicae (nom. inval.)]